MHNLEHGGIFIQYGKDVPRRRSTQLKGFYDSHQNGTLLAPLPSLGSKIALGVWTTSSASSPDNGTAHLAKCTTFDEKAYAAFFDAYQFKGPGALPDDLARCPARSSAIARTAQPGARRGCRLDSASTAGVAKLVIRARLKIGCPSGRLGSTPSPGIACSS